MIELNSEQRRRNPLKNRSKSKTHLPMNFTKNTEENIWSKILLYAKRSKLNSFEEEASHQMSENCTPPISANICQNEKIFFVRSTIK